MQDPPSNLQEAVLLMSVELMFCLKQLSLPYLFLTSFDLALLHCNCYWSCCARTAEVILCNCCDGISTFGYVVPSDAERGLESSTDAKTIVYESHAAQPAIRIICIHREGDV